MRIFKIFILTILCMNSLNAVADNILKININGLSTITRGTVLSYLPLEIGDDYSEEINSKVISSLKKTQFFKEVKVDFKNGVFNVNLIENPTIKFVDFKNYKEDRVLSNDLIEQIIKNLGLEAGKVFSESKLNNLIKQLNMLYSENAYFQTKISLNKTIDEKNRIGIEVFFEEGEQALIKSISVTGNKAFSEDELIDLFDIGEPDFFLLNYFTEKDQFSRTAFNAGIEKVISKYLQNGYLDATFISKDIRYNKSINKLFISLKIQEGVQYKVGEVTFTGTLLGKDPLKLRKLIDVENHDTFRRNIVLEGIKKITSSYQNDGYAYTKLELKVIPVKDTDLIDLIIHVNPDNRIFIDRISISGNYRTQDNVIRRQLKLLEGSVYSKIELEESIRRVRRLGYFSDLTYEIKRQEKDKTKSDLFIRVVETKTGEVSIGLSHSNSTGAAVTAGISQNNILGTGNTLNAKFSNSDAVEQLSLYFKNPYINSKGHSISYGFTDTTINASDLDASDYSISEQGFSFGYGLPLTDVSEIFSEIKFSDLNLICGTILASSDEIAQCSESNSNDLTISFTYASNTLNDFYFPSNGSKNTFQTIIGTPIADHKYYIIKTSHRSYYPVLEDKTFKVSSRLNFASGYGGDELPFYKRFYEGGASSIRGFDFNSLGPKYAVAGTPKGGEISLISSVALSSNLAFAGLDNPNMRVSGFIDGGFISEKISDFDANEIRASSGISFSWLTPIGPIGMHYAWPIIKKSGDTKESFAFELGTTF